MKNKILLATFFAINSFVSIYSMGSKYKNDLLYMRFKQLQESHACNKEWEILEEIKCLSELEQSLVQLLAQSEQPLDAQTVYKILKYKKDAYVSLSFGSRISFLSYIIRESKSAKCARLIMLLLAIGWSPCGNGVGYNPLTFACREGMYRVVRILVWAGASLGDKGSCNSFTAMQIAYFFEKKNKSGRKIARFLKELDR